ncbi:BnaC08g15990D [Brassica napus]|uniref:BnaC08g15990D protein n=2 Tax=Brassica napus TaxID=3708 RepID=A0A078IGX7_BRANA|nr:BnaC08g15990D [Brassica napus]
MWVELHYIDEETAFSILVDLSDKTLLTFVKKTLEEISESDWFDMELPKTQVSILNFSSDKYTLPPFVGKMSSLRELVVINSSFLFPAFLHGLPFSTNLAKLRRLEKVHFPEVLSSTVPLRNLQKMHLILCKINNSFDQTVFQTTHIFPSLFDLTIDHYDDLEKIPSTICGMSALNSVTITNCPRILELP